MNELWYVLLASGLSMEEIAGFWYVPAESGSPYFEVQESVCREQNGNTQEGRSVLPVNPYPRLAKVFGTLMEAEGYRNSEEGRLLFHTFMEQCFQIDRYGGYDKTSFLLELLREELEKGCFGSRMTEIFFRMEKQMQERTLENLLAMYSAGETVSYFIKEVQDIFPQSMLFRHKEQKKQIYIFLRMKKNKPWEERLELVTGLFFPMNYKCSVSWEDPYALLDVEELYGAGNRIG